MSDDIKPALTAEEWATALGPDYSITEGGDGRWALAEGHLSAGTSNYHAIAAHSLYGQPFGFTREDVFEIRAAAGMIALAFNDEDGDDRADSLANLASRIAALLPPDDK